jgi:hypothetical protein
LNGEGPKDPKSSTKVEKGAGGNKLVLPENAKVLNRFLDKDKNNKINFGEKDLEAKAGDVDRFEANGTKYRANFNEKGDFNGYFDGKGNKYKSPSPNDENSTLTKTLDIVGKVTSAVGVTAESLQHNFLNSATQEFKYAEKVGDVVRSAKEVTELNKVSSLNTATKLGKFGSALTIVSAGATIADGLTNKDGWQNHHTADLMVTGSIYTTAASFPVVGWVAGGVYFVIDMGVQAKTGKSITQHIFD